MNARVVELRAPGDLAVVDEPLRAPAEGEILVQTLYSGISTGTELSFVKGTNPALHAAWDPELGAFDRDRAPLGYPLRRLGYMEVARVIESRAAGIGVGERVAMTYGHRSHHVADVAREPVVAIPPDVDALLGVFIAHMGPICANGLLHAAAEAVGVEASSLSDGVAEQTVVVTGAGVVGLLVAVFAAHHGAAAVAVVDGTPRRLAAAAELGFTPLDDRQQPWRWVKTHWGHGPGDRGADVVFQCRGQDWALAEALRCCRPQGTVIDLAFYPGGAPRLHLGEEFHHNGLAIRAAQIARVPRGLAGRWDRERLAAETILVLRAHGPAIRRALISLVVSSEQAPLLLMSLATGRRHALQAVLDYAGDVPS